jgi:hypothetical protein
VNDRYRTESASADVELQHLAGTTGPVGVTAVDRDPSRARVAQHDAKIVLTERLPLAVMQDPLCQQATVGVADL